jgi:hypothetical protein
MHGRRAEPEPRPGVTLPRMKQVTTLERAFELAKSGECGGIQDIKDRLRREGYSQIDDQLYGRALARQLKGLCAEARARADSSDV